MRNRDKLYLKNRKHFQYKDWDTNNCNSADQKLVQFVFSGEKVKQKF